MTENADHSRDAIVIATYCELANLKALVPRLAGLMPGASLIIVDDNSPDGSPEWLREAQGDYPGLKPIIREKKSGYGSAITCGLEAALDEDALRIATMDADFSHAPGELPALFDALESADVAIGSRYYHGVRVLNWHPGRLILSLFANKYVKAIIGIPVHDATSGFRAYRSQAVEILGKYPVRSIGYSYLVEVLTILYRSGLRIVEVPIIYTERREGQSKMSGSIIFEAAVRPWILRFRRWK